MRPFKAFGGLSDDICRQVPPISENSQPWRRILHIRAAVAGI